MTRALLSVGVGAPVALGAMMVLFVAEYLRISGRRRPALLYPVALVAIVVLMGLIVARFAKYA